MEEWAAMFERLHETFPLAASVVVGLWRLLRPNWRADRPTEKRGRSEVPNVFLRLAITPSEGIGRVGVAAICEEGPRKKEKVEPFNVGNADRSLPTNVSFLF